MSAYLGLLLPKLQNLWLCFYRTHFPLNRNCPPKTKPNHTSRQEECKVWRHTTLQLYVALHSYFRNVLPDFTPALQFLNSIAKKVHIWGKNGIFPQEMQRLTLHPHCNSPTSFGITHLCKTTLLVSVFAFKIKRVFLQRVLRCTYDS